MIVRYICMYVYIYIYIILFDPHLWLNEAGHHIIWSVVQLIQRFTSERLWKIAGEPKTVHSSIVTAFRTRLIKKKIRVANSQEIMFLFFLLFSHMASVESCRGGCPQTWGTTRMQWFTVVILIFSTFLHCMTRYSGEKKIYI